MLAAADTLPEHPTEFELMTAIGFLWFAEAGCDLVVVEVGLGGRLDSTNVIPAPEVAVITNIGLEHTAILGSTLAAIAAEKSGILKPGCRAVLYGQSREVGEIVARACPMFVPLVENGYFNDGNPVTKLIIAEYLQELKDAGVDTLILGCTHYPLLKKMIGDFMGGDVHLVDSGKVTAQAY